MTSYTTEIVWNAGLAGTGVSSEGRALSVGRGGDWSPEDLIVLAAESCFMGTLLALAVEASVEILGYVSAGHLDVSADSPLPPAITLLPCVVVGSDADALRIHHLAAVARHESVVARALGDRLHLTLDVRSVPR